MVKRKSIEIGTGSKTDQDQNEPPVGSAEKRSKSDQKHLLLASNEGNQLEKSFSENNSESFVTPAIVVNSGNNCPGAPRIILVSQDLNSESTEERVRQPLEPILPVNLLRTPPTVKSHVYVKSNKQLAYRGYDPFDRLSDELILRVLHQLPRHMMCTCALVCRRWARLVCDLSLWQRMDFESRAMKPGVLKIILERGVQVLRLSRCEIMGDFSSTVQGDADPSSPLSEDRMYRLQLLDMTMSNVNTSLVSHMLRFCPKLTKLSLENIPVNQELLENLGLNSPYLSVLNLSMCQGVEPLGMQTIFQFCTRLRELNIAWTGMNAEQVKAVASSLPGTLRALNFSGCREKLTDEVFSEICDRCPNLDQLDISDSTELTNAALDGIVEKLPLLRSVSLSRCYKLSTPAIINLSRAKSLVSINVFGLMRDPNLSILEDHMKGYRINKELFSTIARPTPYNVYGRYIWNQSPGQGPSLDLSTH